MADESIEQPEVLDEEPVEDLDEAAEVIECTYSITSYGADYPVDSLVKRIEAGDILVPTFSWNRPEKTGIVGFQRQYVWPRPKLIASLSLCCLAFLCRGSFW